MAPNDPQNVRACTILEEIAKTAILMLESGPYEKSMAGVEKVARAAALFDGAVGVCALMRSFGQAHAAIVARSMMELLGDIYWLCDSADYLYRLELTSSCRIRRDATAFIKATRHNPQFRENILQQREMARAEKVMIARLLKEHPGLRELRPGERIAAPGLASSLQFAYSQFSKDTHHDAFRIRRRVRPDGNIAMGDVLDMSQVLSTLCLCAIIVVAAMEKLDTFVRVQSNAAYQIEYARSLSSALDALWRGGSAWANPSRSPTVPSAPPYAPD